MRLSFTIVLLFLIVVCLWKQHMLHASFTPEPAQYSLNKLVQFINGDGKPKLQAGFGYIYSIHIATESGQLIMNEGGTFKQFSLDSEQAVVVPCFPGIKFSFVSSSLVVAVSNNDGSEFYYLDETVIKRWKGGVISVIAGNGTLDDRYYLSESNATQTFLNNPTSLFLQQDSLYISGYGIAKLNLTTGMISTVFQLGKDVKDMSISKDGYMYFTIGQGLRRCEFSSDCSSQQTLTSCDSFIHVEDRGEVYYTYDSNYQIYHLNLTSLVSTLIYQMPAKSNTRKIMDYRNNMLYFIENSNSKIKKINLMDRSVSDEAGNGYSGFVQENVPSLQAGSAVSSIQSIALKNEELYYTDWYTIKKIDRNGIVRRVAGSGTFSTLSNEKETIALQTNMAPNSLSFSKKGELHFVDSNYIIRKVSDNGNVSYVGGNPTSFVSEGDATTAIISPNKIIQVYNELIICENQRIRKVSSEGIISTIVGGGNYPFQEGASATNISFTSLNSVKECSVSPLDKSIYYYESNYLRKLTPSGSVITFPLPTTTSTVFLGFDGNGLIYYRNGATISKINPESLQISAVYEGIQVYMTSVSISNSGDVYYSYLCRIYMIRNGIQNLLVGSELGCNEGSLYDGMNATQPLPNFYSIHYSDNKNQLYFSLANGIWKMVDGSIFKVFQSIAQANVNSTDTSKFLQAPNSLHVKSNGDILFIDGSVIRKYDSQQDVIENVYIGDGSYGPVSNSATIFQWATFCENQLYFLSTRGIRRFNENSIVMPVAFQFQIPLTKAYLSCYRDNLYFGSQAAQSIKKLSLSDGNIENIAGTPGTSGLSPDGAIAKNSPITFSLYGSFRFFSLPNQEVLFYESSTLRKIGLDGRWYTIAGNGSVGITPDFVVNAKNVALSSAINSFAYSELSGKIYFSSNGIYELSPYCRDGYQFDSVYKTSCVPINCFGKLANDSSVCSSRGVCVGIDNCQCSNLYISSDCSVSLCQTESGKQNTILCPQSSTLTNSQPTLNVTESKTEIVKDLTQIDSKNITFTSTSSIQITLPSTISTFVSNQISKNETIQIISAISEKTQIVKPQTSNSGSEQTNEISTIEVVSKVVSLILLKQDGQKIQVSNLINPITFTFTNLIIKSSETLNLTCSYLDEATKEWKSDGLTTNINQITNSGSEQQQVTINCETNHLTSFAVIDMNLKKGNTLKETLPSSKEDNTVLIAAVVSSVVGVFILVSVISIIIIASICLIRRKKATSKE